MDIRRKISDLDCDPLERSETAMILTCPKCATRFVAANGAIGPAGRRVECDVCHEVWFSGATKLQPATDMNVENEAAPCSRPGGVQDAVATSGMEAIAATPLFVERAPPQRKAAYNRSTSRWASIVLLLVAAIAVGVFVFQGRIERAFPGASSAYHSIGLPSADRASR